jgi:myo-inositol-1(or 4)-monophosphatase
VSPAELEQVCVAAAEAGARVLRERYDQPRRVEHKGRIDLVTDADHASEEAVLRVLAERAPGVAVLAEESGARAGQGAMRFIVDPLDGTTNYAHGLPLFCCTVAVEQGGAPLAGCTVDPMRGERFRAARGQGTWLWRDGAERRLAVTEVRDLGQALVCTGFPYDRRERLPTLLEQFARFTTRAQGSRRLGSAAIDLAYVAAGRLDGFWEQGLHAWDVAAGQLLVEEAGGAVTRFDGAPHDLAGGEIVAAGKALHAEMLATLRG